MQNLATTIVRHLKAGHPLVLVTVTAQHGSAPRAAGARMIVFADGTFTGSVGGGAHEAETLVAAAMLHERGKAASACSTASSATRPAASSAACSAPCSAASPAACSAPCSAPSPAAIPAATGAMPGTEACTAAGKEAEAGFAAAPECCAFQGLSLSFSLYGVSDMDMVCGGSLDLLLEYIPAGADGPGSFLTLATKAEREGRSYVFATLIREHGEMFLPDTHNRCGEVSTRRAVFDASGLCRDCLGLDLPLPVLHNALQSRKSTPFSVQNESSLLLVEPFPAPSRLCIFGAGHVSRALSALALQVDFSVSVVDDRTEFANAERFPGAAVTVLPSLNEQDAQAFLARLDPGPGDAIAIITRGHACDRQALAAALGTRAGYIGMIGSTPKRKAVYNNLKEQGFSHERLAEVHSPIGLSIGADTPVEIAVSIVAELIAWRRGIAAQK